MADIGYYYNSQEYRDKLKDVQEKVDELNAEREIEAAEKKKKMRSERNKLKKIFTVEQCGEENMHFVQTLIDRAAFLKVELESMEETLRKQGCIDFFVQGAQTMWREHPLSKVHVQHLKNYTAVITKLESYLKNKGSSGEKDNAIIGLLTKGTNARNKYKQ